MTTEVYRSGIETSISVGGSRRVLLAPTGWYTRYMLRSYAQNVFILTTGLIIIALSIEFARTVPHAFADETDAGGVWLFFQFGSHAALRSVDFATRMLPLGCFLGVLASEVAHTLSRERVMIWNSGRSPMQCLVPVLIFGLCVGALQFCMEAYVRPVTVKMQAAAWMGPFAKPYDRSQVTGRYWLAGGKDLVQARIAYGPPLALHEVMIYRHDDGGKLSELISARRAVVEPGSLRWRLYGGSRWSIDETASAATGGAFRPQEGVPDGSAQTDLIELDLDPLWLSNYRVHASVLPHEVLSTLAEAPGGRYQAAHYRTWLHFRYAQWLYPGGMALLACSLALLLLGQQVRLEAVLAIGAVGYLGYVAQRVCLTLGGNGDLPPVVAGWFASGFVLTVSGLAILLVRLSRPGVGRA
jgi:lipopolysaccharide export system permease protein